MASLSRQLFPQPRRVATDVRVASLPIRRQRPFHVWIVSNMEMMLPAQRYEITGIALQFRPSGSQPIGERNDVMDVEIVARQAYRTNVVPQSVRVFSRDVPRTSHRPAR
jgi:hypothetical protein